MAVLYNSGIAPTLMSVDISGNPIPDSFGNYPIGAHIGLPPVSANFSATPLIGNNPLSVNFYDSSTGEPESWDWDFGDISPHSATQNPTHIYTTVGTYTVILSASNSFSSDVETKINYITVTSVNYVLSADKYLNFVDNNINFSIVNI